MAAAKHEALAWIDGRQPGYQSRSEVNRDRRRNRWEAVIEEKIALSDGIKKSLVQSDLNVTQLRKLEAKVSSQVRQLSWQTSELYSAAVSDSTIATAERLKKDFDFLAERIATRIAERKTHSTKKPTR
ncbi:MAG: hypothetical protein E5Y31_25950 [Mesorhizobium sp.]|nr:MAG: hypothetical protein E5Y31_25950 [Mesorhizobium sp.]